MKLDMQTPDLTDENIKKIAELFPACLTETLGEDGKPKAAIDFDLLKQELSHSVIEGSVERYQLDWPGKRESLLAANAPIAKTLRPVREESVNFDTTENLFIEGDNLEALKLLQESYLGKVKMIYIDPPYNTGNDFVYNDDFAEDSDEYFERSLQKDEEGNRLVANPESKGRYHSDWLSMMHSRLRLARNLLTDDGVIIASIDYYENYNLRKLMDEVFGSDNLLGDLVWALSSGPQAGHFTRANESIIVYAKSKKQLPYFQDRSGGTIKHGALKKISAANPISSVFFEKGCIGFEGDAAEFPNELGGSEKQYVVSGKLKFEKGVLAENVEIKAGWAMRNQLLAWLKGDEVFDTKGQKVLRFYFNSQGILFYEKERGTIHPKTVISSKEVGSTKTGSDEVEVLFGGKIMSFPKPVNLIKNFVNLVCSAEQNIILDFFAGSSTTAHAVMQLNAEDGGNRKFIMVQLPEETDEKSEAFKAGYKNIAEISKERIRRAGKQILESDNIHQDWNRDIGFRVLKIDESNMKNVFYKPQDVAQSALFDQVDNVKEDRTAEDLLFQIMLDWGLSLTLPITTQTIQNKTVYFVADDALIACFDEGITEELVKELAGFKPLRLLFRDNYYANNDVKINAGQLIKQLSPNTELKSI